MQDRIPLRVLLPTTFSECFLSLACLAENSGCSADRSSGKFTAIVSHVVTCDKGPHAVSEEEIGQIRVFLADKVVEGVFILHHRVETLVAPVTPDSADHRSLSVTDMIVGRYDVACVEKGRRSYECIVSNVLRIRGSAEQFPSAWLRERRSSPVHSHAHCKKENSLHVTSQYLLHQSIK